MDPTPAAPPSGSGEHHPHESGGDSAALWEELKGPTMGQIALLDRAVLALMEGSLDATLRQEAHTEAHKLGGTLGVLGFPRGSQLAKAIEHILREGEPLGQAQALRLSELAVDLRAEVERAPGTQIHTAVPRPDGEFPTVLLVNDDRDLAGRLTLEATARGLRAEQVTESGAREAIARKRPDVVLMDLALSHRSEGQVALLAELASQDPPVPAIVLTARGEFVDRVEVAKLGARGFLQKPLPPAEILAFVVDLLDQLRTPQARILAVDSDPQLLVTLRMFLEPKGIHMTTLENPLRFWEMLEHTLPDLLMMDVDLPQLNGVEMCRMVRSDARWRALPIMVLTGHSDSEAEHRAFAAGADDFLRKPVTGAELTTRILNRLERVQLLQRTAETDPLTGLAAPQRLLQVLRNYFRLADRYRQPLTIGILEVNDFEAVVVQYGRAAGDAVLRRVGEILVRSFRGEDVLARSGGAEFAAGMFGMNKDDGVRRLTEVLDAVRREEFAGSGRDRFHVTASAGIAEYPIDGEEWPALHRAGRQALAQSKAGGGSMVLAVGGHPYLAEKGQRADVVLVDDDESVARLLLHALETRGYQTRWLQDGESAVDMLGGANPILRARLVLLDVGLPGLDGLSVLRRLSEDGVTRHTRVMMLTARTEETEVLTAFELGAFDHVAKPFSLPVLLLRIRRALETPV